MIKLQKWHGRRTRIKRIYLLPRFAAPLRVLLAGGVEGSGVSSAGGGAARVRTFLRRFGGLGALTRGDSGKGGGGESRIGALRISTTSFSSSFKRATLSGGRICAE